MQGVQRAVLGKIGDYKDFDLITRDRQNQVKIANTKRVKREENDREL